MRRALVILILALPLIALPGCPKSPEASSGESLLSQVKVRLSARDAKLSSYRLEGTTREQGLEASFGFAYRAPNKVRGELIKPQRRTWSFDGSKLYDLQPDEKRFTVYELKLPQDKAALLLNQTFSPFASEGFRVPLLLQQGVSVTRIKVPKAADAVEVKMQSKDEAGGAITVTYVLRWPALDFLSKKTEVEGRTSEVRVDEEKCDEALGMCFPQKYTHWEGKDPAATTVLSKVELNPQIPAGEFTLMAPEGFEAKSQQFVEEGK
ncbi:MAG: LolA family protein [Myxococcaceae bacterium]